MNHLAEAVESYGKALEIRERVLGKEHRCTGCTYSNLGQVLIHAKRYKEALPILIRLTRCRSAQHGENSLEAAEACFDTGLVCVALGKVKRGFKYLRRTHSIREALLPRNHQDTLAVLAAIRPLMGAVAEGGLL
jgi:tetratricopeptide (TPR) repeat protein